MNAVLIAMISFGSVVLLFCISANVLALPRMIAYLWFLDLFGVSSHQVSKQFEQERKQSVEHERRSFNDVSIGEWWFRSFRNCPSLWFRSAYFSPNSWTSPLWWELYNKNFSSMNYFQIFSAICTYSSNFKLAQFLSTITPFTSDIFSLGPAV